LLLLAVAWLGNKLLIAVLMSQSHMQAVLSEKSDELVAACSDGKLRTYELQFGVKLTEIAGMGLPLIDIQSCCNNQYVTISEQCPVVEVWCLNEGRVMMTLAGAKNPVNRIVVHPRVSLPLYLRTFAKAQYVPVCLYRLNCNSSTVKLWRT
jgi:hypothetical protein